jgi:hypothetical protein
MIGFTDPSWYCYKPYSAIADLHTFQFTAAHALDSQSPLVVVTDLNNGYAFSVFTIRFLATDL